MNTMQKVTAAVVLMCAAGLAAAAALSPATLGGRWTLIILAISCVAVGAVLVAVFAKGDVIARLQKGTVAVALASAVLTMATAPFGNYRLGWQRRLAQYAELRDHAADVRLRYDAMDAVDSVISEHLLAGQPDLWRRYGTYVVACARRNAAPVETVVAVIRRCDSELTAAENRLVQSSERPLRRTPSGLILKSEVDSAIARLRARRNRLLDSVMAVAVQDAKTGRRRIGVYAAPTDVWTPDWLARLTLAGSELLAGFAIVIVLGLLCRKPKRAGENDHAT